MAAMEAMKVMTGKKKNAAMAAMKAMKVMKKETAMKAMKTMKKQMKSLDDDPRYAALPPYDDVSPKLSKPFF